MPRAANGQAVGQLGQRPALFMQQLDGEKHGDTDAQTERLHRGEARCQRRLCPRGRDAQEHAQRGAQRVGAEDEHRDENQEVRPQDAAKVMQLDEAFGARLRQNAFDDLPGRR